MTAAEASAKSHNTLRVLQREPHPVTERVVLPQIQVTVLESITNLLVSATALSKRLEQAPGHEKRFAALSELVGSYDSATEQAKVLARKL